MQPRVLNLAAGQGAAAPTLETPAQAEAAEKKRWVDENFGKYTFYTFLLVIAAYFSKDVASDWIGRNITWAMIWPILIAVGGVAIADYIKKQANFVNNVRVVLMIVVIMKLAWIPIHSYWPDWNLSKWFGYSSGTSYRKISATVMPQGEYRYVIDEGDSTKWLEAVGEYDIKDSDMEFDIVTLGGKLITSLEREKWPKNEPFRIVAIKKQNLMIKVY